MTKTYNDIDAVTRLLEEKERDLELAARIGQSLLKKNKTLSERNEYLEEQVEHIREEVSQLRHDLSMKDELLQFYTNAAEESEGESATSTPVRRNESTASLPCSFPLDSLQKKLKDLEEENIVLRTEANHLETETMCYEEKEQQLVNDCVKELRNANFQISSLAEDLARKTDDASRQQEEITHLLSQIVDQQKKSKAYAVENEELTQHLGAAKDAQRQLTAELRELEDKYAECMEMLHEAQEELKNLRNKTLPLSTPRRFHSLGLFPMDSLAAEIEGTMRKELQMDDPDVEEHKLQPKRVFQTVRNVNQTVRQRSMGPSPMNIPGSNQTSSINSRRSSCVSTPRSSMYGGSMDNRTSSVILEAHTPEDRSDDSNRKQAGTPGTPGSRDLEAALRRLTLRRDNYLSERRFFEDERERKLQELSEKEALSEGRGSEEGDGGALTPTDSIMSLGLSSLHSGLSGFSFYAPRSYLPEKLQIVKPLEGSATLHHWQQLAQPNLGGILDPRPGVVTKGFRPLELDLEEVYQFTDLEEDESGERSSLLGLSVAGHLNRHRLCRSRCSSTSSLASENNNTPLHNNNNGGTFGGAHDHDHDHDHDDGLGQEPSAGATTASAAGTGNGQVATGSLENAEAAGLSSVHFPGKCQSHTSSTYTFTTCRIMHPSDELTRVTPSLMSGPTASCVLTSSVLRCSSTPASTPCTPRRLSVAESFTNLRDSTKTTSTSLGLVRMLQESGISAAVYDPCSWDRAASHPADYANPSHAPPAERAVGQDSRRGTDTLPSTPPNSPTRAKRSSHMAAPPFDYSPSAPPYDNFLASKPASSILKEVREAEKQQQHADAEAQADASVHNLRLLDKVKRLGVAPRPLTLGPFCGGLRRPGGAHAMVTSPIGGLPTLNAGMRRNRSYPAMVGASMAMKGLGPESGTELLLPTPLPKQTSLNRE